MYQHTHAKEKKNRTREIKIYIAEQRIFQNAAIKGCMVLFPSNLIQLQSTRCTFAFESQNILC